MIYVFLAEGFEEIEALTPVDCLRRAGKDVCTVGIGGTTVKGSHGIPVTADLPDSAFRPDDSLEMIVLPGGRLGTENLGANDLVVEKCREFAAANGDSGACKYLAAICAAPALVLGSSGIVAGRKVTCYPGMEHHFSDAIYCHDLVVRDNNIITSQGQATAMLFALELLKVLKGESNSVANGILWNKIMELD